MLTDLKAFLDKYFNNNLRPGCITIAISSLDDYCPPEQVDFIQTETLNLIQSFFTKTTVKNCYS